MRADIAAQLDLAPSVIADDADLIGLGLDSLRAMRLVGRWRRAGARIVFADLAGETTLGAWWALVSSRLTALVQEERADAARGGHRGVAQKEPAGVAQAGERAPFPLTPVQLAYWIGRADGQPLGGVGCHAYLEFDGHDVDPDRLETAVRALVRRHGMLRAVFHDDGTQRVTDTGAWPGLTVYDTGPAQVRADLSHRRFDAARGEVFDVRLSLLPGGATRVHVEVDFLAADVLGLQIFLRDLARLYLGHDLPPLTYSFPRYVAARQEAERAAPPYEARDYWRSRDLPGPPQLPLATDPGTVTNPRFTRREHWLDVDTWKLLKERAREHAVTPAMVLATAYCQVLAAWSAESRFLLNVPLFDRDETLHPDVPHLVADFTNLILLEADLRPGESFAAHARALQHRFRTDVRHTAYSGVDVLRDLAKQGRPPAAPVVFACNLGTDLIAPEVGEAFGQVGWMITQTPQVWLDHQINEYDHGLHLAWDAVDRLFAPGVLDAMFATYTALLEHLALADWSTPAPLPLPKDQQEVRQAANDTAGPLPEGRLHDAFFALAAQDPDRPALAGDFGSTTYGELARAALTIAARLRAQDARPGDTVAVTLPKGPAQVAAVLGVLAAGCAYVPIGTDQPDARRARILTRSSTRHVIDTSWPVPGWLRPGALPAGEAEGGPAEHLAVSGADDALPGPIPVDPDSPAYVIFTSGSTGEPKGVEVTHRAAVNTITGINDRYGVGPDDRMLAVSALDFDLSVYDLFGILGAGGTLILIEEDQRRDPQSWARLCASHGVTLWNTVPTLLDMLLITAPGLPESLRLALVSGDWVGLDLPGRLTAQSEGRCHLVALGGATEAAIWSNAHDVAGVPPHWTSIPYGRPLRNQRYRVAAPDGGDRPDWVPGELWIGGAGLATAYRGDPETTTARFVHHGGERWYRTGDLGRYWPDGTLEFLGRADHQVKIRGHRIELGEVEAALESHPSVTRAIAVAVGERTRRRLLAFTTLAPSASGSSTPDPSASGPGPSIHGLSDPGLSALGESTSTASQGPGGTHALTQPPTPGAPPAHSPMSADDLRDHVAGLLPGYAVPASITVLDRLPLTPNGKVDRAALTSLAVRQAQPEEAAATGDAPQGEAEATVAAIWADLLEVPEVGRDAGFFALGGDSLLATRLIARLRSAGVADARLSVLFERPVLRDFASTLTLGAPTAEGRGLEADEERRHDPFPPTEVQRAYWLGRSAHFTLGGVGCHFYTEFDGDIDLDRLEEAWNRLILRHDMLRVVFDAEGLQRVLAEVPRFTIGRAGSVEELRERMSHQVLDPAVWPLFDARAVRHEGGVRLGVSFDNIAMDALSTMVFLNELDLLYRDPDAEPAPVEVTFRDYLMSQRPDPAVFERAREYWAARLPELPPAPRLPLAVRPEAVERPRFARREARVPARVWRLVSGLARGRDLTPSTVLAAAFGEVLGAWSGQPELTLNLTLFDRREVHPDVHRVLGDFTSLMLVAHRAGRGWLDGARGLQEEVWRGLEHGEVSAVWVMRELARRAAAAAMTMPVVFTSTLGVAAGELTGDPSFGRPVWGVSQTPQIWLDCQVGEVDGDLLVRWDAVEELFAPGELDTAFAAYLRVLEWLATADWSAPVEPLRAAFGPRDGLEAKGGFREYGGAVPPDDPDRVTHQPGPPRPGLETELAAIWAELLETPVIGRVDNFFVLGGDSLLATRMAAIAGERLGMEPPLRRFFADPTLAGCAEAMDDIEEGLL
ncbi:non-ribosomal peptide synthetase [Nonomuraea typhae]|uniref:non-ribosomal peptide synthetase n=1 Tax=Nonomuraea typhae TaxID=2603600 RepID=UPI0012F9150E|nr:non-ribosomal peptide synthetase [Nonomuraea typhae]